MKNKSFPEIDIFFCLTTDIDFADSAKKIEIKKGIIIDRLADEGSVWIVN